MAEMIVGLTRKELNDTFWQHFKEQSDSLAGIYEAMAKGENPNLAQEMDKLRASLPSRTSGDEVWRLVLEAFSGAMLDTIESNNQALSKSLSAALENPNMPHMP